MGAQPGLCGRRYARSSFSALLFCLQNQALTFFSPRSLCHAAAGLGTKDDYFTCPGCQKQRKPSQSFAAPQQLWKPLSSDIYSTPDTSWESFKLFWKQIILLQVPIFRLYKAHVRFLLSFSLSTKPAIWKARRSFVFRRSAPSGSLPTRTPKPWNALGLCLFPHSDHNQNRRWWPSDQSSWDNTIGGRNLLQNNEPWVKMTMNWYVLELFICPGHNLLS